MPKYVHMERGSVDRLCKAIIGQAIKDYTTEPEAYWGADANAFFKSDWFEIVSNGMDGEAIVSRLNQKIKEFQELCGKNRPKVWKDAKEAAKCEFCCPFCGGKVKIQWNGKGMFNRKYTFQCESCGIRQTFYYQGSDVSGEENMRYCRDCEYYRPSMKMKPCSKHRVATASKLTCEDWKAKER